MDESVSSSSSAFLRLTSLRAAKTETVESSQVARRDCSDLVLLSMPFGPVRYPSIGLSLLKASIQNVSTRILYFTLAFAERIGADTYEWIARGRPRDSCVLGEWIFSGALFGDRPDHTQQYLDEVLVPEAGSAAIPDKVVKKILYAREIAGPFLDVCVDQVVGCAPRIVGFTSVSHQQVASLGLAQRLKVRCPEISIIFGGANCEGTMGLEILRQFPYVDLVVSGEGDLIFAELVHRLLHRLSLADLQGVYTRQSPAVTTGSNLSTTAPSVCNMDALPYPDYDDFVDQWNASRVSKKLSMVLPFETSRGCWWGAKHHCTFCGLNGMTMEFRSKTQRRAIEELVYLTKRYRCSSVAAVDNILDMKYFREFVPELTRLGLKVTLYYEVKSNLSKEQVRQLYEAGIREIQPGIESFSDSVLMLMRKGVTGLQNIQLLKWCKEIGVRPWWNILWGFPGESPEEYARMAGMLPLLAHLDPPELGIPISLHRFSPNFDKATEMGFSNIVASSAYTWIYPISAGDMFNLAYYFDYKYSDGRDVTTYTNDLAARIAEWQTSHAGSKLFYTDDGTRLFIWDFRPMALRSLTILDGLQRELYLASDKVSSTAQLARACGKGDVPIKTIEDALCPLIENGLIIRDGEHVLSLAVLRSHLVAGLAENKKKGGHASKASQRALTSSTRASNRGSLRILSRKGSRREIIG
jgi:ribosomal peptide maturation radical SAM protein 1